MRLLCAMLLVICCARTTTAQNRDGWPTHIALGTYLTAAFADVSQTAYCLGQGTCRELNPIMRPIMDRHGVVPALALKGAINTGVAAILLHDHHRYPKRAFWLSVVAASVQTAVVVHNYRATRP